MQNLERVVLETFDFDIPFYYSYVDDIVLAVPLIINSVFKKFNSIHSKLQFTIKIGKNSINFLDTTIIIKDKKNFVQLVS